MIRDGATFSGCLLGAIGVGGVTVARIGGGGGKGCFNAGDGVASIFEINGDGIAANAPPSGRIPRFGPLTGGGGLAMRKLSEVRAI